MDELAKVTAPAKVKDACRKAGDLELLGGQLDAGCEVAAPARLPGRTELASSAFVP